MLRNSLKLTVSYKQSTVNCQLSTCIAAIANKFVMKILLVFLCLTVFARMVGAQSAQKTTPIKKAAPGNAGTKAAPSSGTSLLQGIFSAPTGTSVVLQINGKSDLTIAAGKVTGIFFNTNTFKFPTALPDKTAYKISIKKTPAAQTTAIYSGGEGTMPADANKIRVGSDFTYDLVSRSTNDATFSTFYESSDGVVGGNNGEEGRYVAFISSAAGFSGSTGKHRQVFWRDRNTGVTKLISAAPGGEAGNGDCYAPAISGDGKSVAFESNATNLVQEDKNGVRDVFIWNSSTNAIKKVSIGMGGQEANADSYEASVSGDGSLVAFTSTASNISATEKGVSNNNVFLYDVKKENSIMISIDPISRKGGGGSKPSISHDGNRIAFYSHTATLVVGDNNELWDIFLWEKNTPIFKRISLTADGKERNQGTESANRIIAPSISGNGQYVAFATTATNMVPGDINSFQDVFVYDINTGSTVIASTSSDGKPGNADSPIEQGEKIAISFDGKWVAFSTNASNLGAPAANIVLRNMATGQNRAVSSVTGSSVGRPTMSYTAAYIVFGIGGKLDGRYPASGIFANYTGLGPCRSCPD
jgi:WD40-like Beta Propeller Repeat